MLLSPIYTFCREGMAVKTKPTKNQTKSEKTLLNDCQGQLDEFYNSDFSCNLRFRLEKRQNGGNPIVNQFLKSDWLAQGSSKILVNTKGTNAAANGLKAFSGSKAHEWVLNIGHYFGHSFKPWEAVKWVKKINIAGKALGIFGVVLSWGLQAKEDYDEDKRNREIRAGRERIRAGFNDAANSLVIHYTNSMTSFLNDNYRNLISEMDTKIEEIREARKDKSEACALLESAQSECRHLIADIHKASVQNA